MKVFYTLLTRYFENLNVYTQNRKAAYRFTRFKMCEDIDAPFLSYLIGHVPRDSIGRVSIDRGSFI